MFIYGVNVAADLSLGAHLFPSSPLCLVPFMSPLSLHRQCSCFCVSLQSVTVSVFVWCLSTRKECLNLCLSIHLSCCVFLRVSAVGLCVFFSKSVGMYIYTHTHTHTHTQGRTLGSPNMLNGPLRFLHVGLGVGGEGGQREAAGFCKNIKSQIK